MGLEQWQGGCGAGVDVARRDARVTVARVTHDAAETAGAEC